MSINKIQLSPILLGLTVCFAVACKAEVEIKTSRSGLQSKDQAPPTAGTFSVSDGVGTTGFVLNWSAASDGVTAADALEYFLCSGVSAAAIDTVAECEAATEEMAYTADTLTRTITGRTPSTTYHYNAVVRDAVGNKSFYETKTQATTADVTAPTGVAAVSTTSQNSVSWTAVTGATSYNIYFATSLGVTTGSTKITGATSPYTHVSLTNATTYYYKVEAVTASGVSGLSSEVNAKPIAIPTGVAASSSDAQNSISWTAVTGATAYNIYWGTGTGITTGSTKITGATSAYAHTSLTNGTTYYYKIEAVNGTGASALSSEVDIRVLDWILGAASATEAGVLGDGNSDNQIPVAVSSDGRFVAFRSLSTNLVPGASGVQVYRKNLETGQIDLVSCSAVDTPMTATGGETSAAISGDGRFIAFAANNMSIPILPGGQTAGPYQIYRKDMNTGEVVWASIAADGSAPNSGNSMHPHISDDGNLVSFQNFSASNFQGGVTGGPWVKNIATGEIKGINSATNYAYNAKVAPNGRYVTFQTIAPLVAEDTNVQYDTYRWNLTNETLIRVSTTETGAQVSSSINFYDGLSSVSNDGLVAFLSSSADYSSDDTNVSLDIFVKNPESGVVILVSANANGTIGNGHSYGPSISSNGRYVVFSSAATNLVDKDTNEKIDVFLKDLQTGSIRMMSRLADGTQGDNHSYFEIRSSDGAISADGRVLAFATLATNLIPNDTNEQGDIVVMQLK